jgi:uncharacterized protein (DUF58 family)
LVCGFPFGLREASRPVQVAASLLVWPRIFPVAAVPEAVGLHTSDGLATRDRAGNWGDPLGVRPYRRGDPLRRVHWGLSARHGELIVREVQSNAVPRVRIVLDARPHVHADLGPDGSREWAVRVAASLAVGWIGQGAEVEIVLGGTPIRPRGTVKARSAAALDALARLGPGGDLDLADALNHRTNWSRRGGLRVVVTTDIGLRAMKADGLRRGDDRLVVLTTRSFGPDEGTGPNDLLSFVPWIRIDGPEHVAACFRRIGKEVALGC